MLSGIRRRVKKAGQPPGTPMYTGKQKIPSLITFITFNESEFVEKTGQTLAEIGETKKENGINWLNLEGLSNLNVVEEIAQVYQLHPLTVEDILNVEQRPKVDEFENYLFITIKILNWNSNKNTFSVEQMSLVLGKSYVITFLESNTTLFNSFKDKLRSSSAVRLRQQGCDYLAYRLIDIIVDQYFSVLEGLGEAIEDTEERIILSPTPQNSKTIYSLKRKMLILRKTIWPMREVISHLLQIEEPFISRFTQIYLRDVYDHIVQAIDTIETFRDMLSSMIDMYLSSLTNRMNEIIKVLTIISTIFIPTTFIASIYGMNFQYMPELKMHYGYPAALGAMLVVIIGMLIYFKNKKWL